MGWYRTTFAALRNPEGHGLVVSQLDQVAWQERGVAVARGEPLPSELWARVIRAQRLRVEPLAGALLPLDSAWPAGRVVTVTTSAGGCPSYFAVPRGLLHLGAALTEETGVSQEIRASRQIGPPASSEE